MNPRDAITEKQILKMDSDNFSPDPKKWSIMNNGDYVSLHSPLGRGWVEIPKDQFDAIVDWYMADQP